MNRAKLIRFIVVSSAILMVVGIGIGLVVNVSMAEEATATPKSDQKAHPSSGLIALAAALSIAGGMVGAGYAVGHVGSAAIGAAAERPEIVGRALLFVAMGEGIAVLGLVGGVMLMRYLQL
jgi:V/A-type H+-transporting ATPase subunit K